jgi:hypothetical protein
MTCPYLSYQRSDGEREFDHDRPYCTIQRAFVSPMQADVCNDRYGYSHAEHCDIYLAETRETGVELEPDGGPTE